MSVVLNPEQTKVVDEIRESLDIEGIGSYTLSDAMRRAAEHTEQEYGWGSGRKACAWHAAALDAVATGYVR
jgi:hypothetical protein